MLKIIKRLLIGIVLAIVLVLLIMIGTISILISTNKNEQDNIEKVIGTGDKKVLILYQDSVSDVVSKTLDEIVDSMDENDYTITTNHPRSDSTYQVSDYDMVVFLTPVYVGHISEPLQNFAKGQDFTDVNVVNIITGRRESSPEIELLEGCIESSKSMSTMKIYEPDEKTIETIHNLLIENMN